MKDKDFKEVAKRLKDTTFVGCTGCKHMMKNNNACDGCVPPDYHHFEPRETKEKADCLKCKNATAPYDKCINCVPPDYANYVPDYIDDVSDKVEFEDVITGITLVVNGDKNQTYHSKTLYHNPVEKWGEMQKEFFQVLEENKTFYVWHNNYLDGDGFMLFLENIQSIKLVPVVKTVRKEVKNND